MAPLDGIDEAPIDAIDRGRLGLGRRIRGPLWGRIRVVRVRATNCPVIRLGAKANINIFETRCELKSSITFSSLRSVPLFICLLLGKTSFHLDNVMEHKLVLDSAWVLRLLVLLVAVLLITWLKALYDTRQEYVQVRLRVIRVRGDPESAEGLVQEDRW